MKVSELWLREWVNPNINSQEIASLLTMAGLEVDALSPVAPDFHGVIIAKVLQTSPHPEANKLTLCEVDCGNEKKINVVCGAANVRSGLKVALAEVGAILPNGVEIKESLLRGQLSQGMLCSYSELGITESSEGIAELEDDAPLGMNLRDYLSLDDKVIDVDLTPNRADCLSIQGIARELSALTHCSLKFPSYTKAQPLLDDTINIQSKDLKACPRYAGRIIRGINPQAKSPIWMKERLRRSGLRSLHPVVDVTNYVMLELGQPMHAFNLGTIDDFIQIRFAHSNENIELLDNRSVNLNEKTLVIADHHKALAVAGIMGGKYSSVTEFTTDIFLESAFFNPIIIAETARSLNITTDSTQRFERGVDPNLHLLALERATALLLDITGGKAGPICSLNHTEALINPLTIAFNPNKVQKLTGIDIPETKILEILNNLGMRVENKESIWSVTIPSYRFDIKEEVDIVEEIIRINGYDKLTGSKMEGEIVPGTIDPLESIANLVSSVLVNHGYNETISYSFVDPEIQQELLSNYNPLKLINPISSELSEMRVSLWPGLLASMIYNQHRQQTAIKLFEQGVVFNFQEDKVSERSCVAGLLSGEYGTLNWSLKKKFYDFFDMKGDVEALLNTLNIKQVNFVPQEHPSLHPGKSARIFAEGQELGVCGILHPKIAAALDLSSEVVLFELYLEKLINSKLVRFKPISKYPQIRRDLSFLVDKKVSAYDIETAVRQTVNQNQLKSFNVFDVYTGEGVPEGKKSLGIALSFQEEKRTMVECEINAIIDAIIKLLNKEFAITLRD